MGGFFRAGARAVMVSLWRVEDETTSRLMIALYDARFRQGATWPKAIRDAMLAARHTAEVLYPANPELLWAPFKPVGLWE